MDISTASIKTPDPETEVQTRLQPAKQLLSTNGVLKRHHLNPPPQQPAAEVVTYKECLKNHAATMGGHAVDGCGEFMPSPSADLTNPTSLKCAACGCHRNFHRLDADQLPPPSSTHQIIEYQPHHRHHPPPPRPRGGHISSPTKSNSASPPPISSSYMLLALSGGGGAGGGGLSVAPQQETGRLVNHSGGATCSNPSGRKRFRTKFSQNQKEKMLQFAERVGWKMQRKDEELITGFCGEIGVEKGVFKVWMHNNKSTFGKNMNKVNHNHHNNGSGSGVNFGNTTPVSSNYHHQENTTNNGGSSQVSGHEGVVANGSSSSS